MYIKYLKDDGDFKEGDIDLTNKESGTALIDNGTAEETTKEASDAKKGSESTEDSSDYVNPFAENSRRKREAVNGTPRKPESNK